MKASHLTIFQIRDGLEGGYFKIHATSKNYGEVRRTKGSHGRLSFHKIMSYNSGLQQHIIQALSIMLLQIVDINV